MANLARKLVFYFFLIVSIYKLPAQTGPEYNPDVEKVRVLLKAHFYGKAISLSNKNIELHKTNPEVHSWFLSTKGLAYLDTLDADSAVVFFEKSLAQSYSINYKKSICNSLYGLGKYYYRNSNYITALKYFQLLNYYSLNDTDKNYRLISNYYLSANYNLLNKHRLSIDYARKAASIAISIPDTSSYIKSILSIATQFFILENLDSTEFYCIKANSIYSSFSNKNMGIGADINNVFLKVQLIKKDYDKGIIYGKLAVIDCIENNSLASLNTFYDNLAICYTSKKQYDSAAHYYEKALDLELQYNYVDEYKQDLRDLFQIYTLLGNTQKTIFYAKKYLSADSLYQKASIENAVDSLKTAFEFEKSRITLKADEEKLQEIYKKKQFVYLSIGIILFLLLTGLAYAIYLRKVLRKEKEKQSLMLQVKDSEIKALQSQMNPHFIFNSLNSVLEFISRSETDDAIKYLTKFSRLIRLVLEFSNRKTILLSEDLELLRIYVELENIRSENGFSFVLRIEEDLDVKNYEVPSMLLQPFIENSIIHGIFNKIKLSEQEHKLYKGELRLSISKTEDALLCVIQDNGVGLEKAMEIKQNKSFNHLSMGMRITKDRLSLISQNKCQIKYVDLDNPEGISLGTRVEILIPLLESF